MTAIVYEVFEDALPRIKQRVVKINKRADRLGFPPVYVADGIWQGAALSARLANEFPNTPPDELPIPRRRRIRGKHYGTVLITIVGKTPRLNGWVLVAVIQHTEQGNILRPFPGFYEATLPMEYRTANPNCDHCRTNRYRKDTFLLWHEQHGYTQVGRNCLADYTGAHNPHIAPRLPTTSTCTTPC
jgi:hypothetical protein